MGWLYLVSSPSSLGAVRGEKHHAAVILLVVLGGLGFTFGAHAEATSPGRLTLARAVAIAKADAPAVHVALQRVTAARAELREARSRYWPTLSASLGGSAYASHGTLFASGLQATGTGRTALESRVGLGGRMAVYDFGQTARAVDAAQSSLEAAKLEALAQEEQAMAEAAIAFYTVVADQELSVAALNAQAERERVLAITRRLVSAGIRAPVDELRAQVAVDVAVLELAVAEEALKRDSAALAAALALDPASELQLATPDDAAASGEVMEIDAALRANPDLNAQRARVAQARHAVQAARNARWPTLELDLQAALLYTAASVRNPGAPSATQLTSPSQYAAGTLTLSAPLFDAALDARVATAETRVGEAERVLAQHQFLTRLDARQTSQALRSAQHVLGQAQRVERGAVESLAVAEGRYANGVDDALTVGDAQREANDARKNVIQARLGLRVSRVRFLLAFSRIHELLK